MKGKISFRYFYGAQADQYSFYRIPKALFTNDYFKDRMSLSIKNQWFDEQNHAYIYFSIEDIMELLNCGRNKAVKSLQELDTETGIGLIEKKRQGLSNGFVNIRAIGQLYAKQRHRSCHRTISRALRSL